MILSLQFFTLRKCFVESLTRVRTVISFKYGIHNVYFRSMDSVRDLKISFDSQLDFDLHINYVSKGLRIFGFIKCCTWIILISESEEKVAFKLNMNDVSDADFCHLLNLLPLEVRHLQRDLKTFYKSLHGNLHCRDLLERSGIWIPT